jgi:CubicO group peptidase (beta-lactamase class C family)
VTAAEIEGHVAQGFERVADVFRDNFRRRDELGAAVAVYRGHERLVDLWGGVANRQSGARWQRDTVILMYSATKGLTGLTLAHAHSRGLFDYDEPVSRYWPEFAQHRKDTITIRQLLSHQAGLAAVDEALTPELLADHDRRDALLARQRPEWAPGQHHGYHTTSFGFYAAALLRRSDKQRRGVSAYFADEIAKPLGLAFWIGLPRDFAIARLGRIDSRAPRSFPDLRKIPFGLLLQAINSRSLTMRSLLNPYVKRASDLDAPTFWHLEHPSTIGIGEVRAIARAYSEFASGAKTLAIDRRTLDAIECAPTPPPGGLFDLVMRMKKNYSLGFTKPMPHSGFGTSHRAYGTAGMGGSFAFADPDQAIGYAYAPNRLGIHIADDPREKALRDAVYSCLRKRQ